MATIKQEIIENRYFLTDDDQKTLDNLNNLSNTGLRYNKGKKRYDLLPPDGIDAIVDVFDFGARKYSDRNWELGMSWMAVVASLKRHLAKFELGELCDSESGLYHSSHLAWNALALLTYELRGIGTDDRPRFWEGKLNNQGELDIG